MDPLALLAALLLFALLGVGAGVVTGLVPGLHVNTVVAFVVAFQGSLLALAGTLLAWAHPKGEDLLLLVAVLVVGHVVAHTFLDYVPSIFLGAPEAETALSVLPGHRMLLRGRGLVAVRLSAWGSLAAALLSLALAVPFRLLMGPPVSAYEDLRSAFPLLLALVAALLVVSEGGGGETGPRELVCRLPQGLQGDEDLPPGVRVVGPAEARTLAEAFLLRGRVLALQGDRVELGGAGARIRVRLEGRPDRALEGEVTLFVLPAGRGGPGARLRGKGLALGVFLLAGALGVLVLQTPLLGRNWFPLPGGAADARTLGFLPLFTGLFGLPTLLLSLARAPAVPEQALRGGPTGLTRRASTRAVLGGSLAGAFVAWIPGVTAATATVLSQLLTGHEEDEGPGDEAFILSLSCVNTAAAIFAVVALFVILRARSGAAVALQALAPALLVPWDPLLPLPATLGLFLAAAGVAALAAFVLTGAFGTLFARMANRVPYRALALGVALLLVAVLLLLAGAVGLAVAGVATCVGLLPPLLGIRRVHLMGCLIVPLVLLLT